MKLLAGITAVAVAWLAAAPAWADAGRTFALARELVAGDAHGEAAVREVAALAREAAGVARSARGRGDGAVAARAERLIGEAARLALAIAAARVPERTVVKVHADAGLPGGIAPALDPERLSWVAPPEAVEAAVRPQDPPLWWSPVPPHDLGDLGQAR